MITIESLFQISYGLYVIGVGNKEKGNAYISNTFFQVTADPPQFATCCNKNNYSCHLIEENNAFSVSVLHQHASIEIFGKLGYQSGSNGDKLEGLQIKHGESGVPIILDDSVAYFECKVVKKLDVGTHIIFIGELLQAELINEKEEPITYLEYRRNRKGMAPKNAPTYIDKSQLEKTQSNAATQHKCAACGYVYDDAKENATFGELPHEWTCPVCGSEKEDFIQI